MTVVIGHRALLAGAAGGVVFPSARAQSVVAEPPCDPLWGVAGCGVHAFLGIPYAAAPGGPMRYVSPRPAPR